MGTFNYEEKVSKTSFKTDGKNIPVSKEMKPKKCANCESENTICVYSDGSGCIIGWTWEEEFYCQDCNYYTLYISDYES